MTSETSSSSLRPPLQASEVAIDDELPPLEIAIDRTFVIAAAIATRDYQDVHHDHEAAVKRGAPDIFLNILTTTGLVNRFVTDWAGPHARINKTAIRLGMPAHPGDTLTFTGTVTESADGVVTVSIDGTTARGSHASGSVTLSLSAVADSGDQR